MKKLLIVTLSLITGYAYAQEQQYLIEGKIGNLKSPACIILHCSYDQQFKSDTVFLKDGAFRFSGTTPRALPATLYLDHTGMDMRKKGIAKDRLNIVLENGKLTIRSSDSLVNATVSGSAETQARVRMHKLVKPYEDSVAAIFDPSGNHQWDKTIAEEKIQTIISNRNAALRSFVQKNPDALTSLMAIDLISRPTPQYNVLKPLYDQLSERIKNTKGGKSLGNFINSMMHTSVGSTAPDFALPDSSGKILKLSDFSGKFVLLDFWGSWCGPCRAENPNLVKAYHLFKNKNFTILGVALEQKNAKQQWLKAIAEDQLTWTQVCDFKYWYSEVVPLYGIQGVPQNYLIDPKGNIIGKNLRGQDLLDTLKKVLE